VYKRQCAAQPGFSTSFSDPNADRTSFADYRRLCAKWQHTVTAGVRTALLSEDAVQIRNAFLILTTTLKVMSVPYTALVVVTLYSRRGRARLPHPHCQPSRCAPCSVLDEPENKCAFRVSRLL
jgi:hypothetical protein